MPWPPLLDELKDDLSIADNDDRDDESLTRVLGAAVAFVERVHTGRYNFTGDPESELSEADESIELGTIRLAGRWYTRRRSPDGLVESNELGASRIPSVDPDIDRLLRIGRHARAVVG